jgi:tetratricopeptide (TPR) repeat protein
MNTEQLLEQGNQHRADHHPEQALTCYAQIFGQDFNHGAAFNNYGNVLREMGYPERAIPFLHAAHDIDPANVTAEFNLAVAYLLKGDYNLGWKYYESRWRYEHMAGNKPKPPFAARSPIKPSPVIIPAAGDMSPNFIITPSFSRLALSHSAFFHHT